MTDPTQRDSDCPNTLHDHPLPRGYAHAAGEADRRLYRGWANLKCPDCGMYGWRPGPPSSKSGGDR